MGNRDSHQLINQTSGDVEIYTPPEIVDAWHEVLDGVPDLDPASSEVANRLVRAKQIYTEPRHEVVGSIQTELDDGTFDRAPTTAALPIRRYADWGGLAKPWCGKVVLNAPFGTPQKACGPGCASTRCIKRGWHSATDLPGMPHWIGHLVAEHTAGRLTEGLTICFAATSEGWFRPLLRYPQCFLHGRTNYVLPDGTRYKGVTKGSCVTYLGPNVARFAAVFGRLGTVKVPYGYPST